MNTPSAQRARINARLDGRGSNAAYTGGAKTVGTQLYEKAVPEIGFKGYAISEAEAQRRAHNERRNLVTYTRTKDGKLSINGKNTKGAVTHALTPKKDDGSAVLNDRGEVRNSGRNGQLATRSQRDYDNRKAMNNISPRVVERWRQLGWVREVDGSLRGDGTNVRGITIHQKADGNYSMGLSVG